MEDGLWRHPIKVAIRQILILKTTRFFVQKSAPYLEFRKIINNGFSAKMLQNHVVNFNITLNGNTSMNKSVGKYTIFFGYGQIKSQNLLKLCDFRM